MARLKNEIVEGTNESLFTTPVALKCPKTVTLADFDDKQIFEELSRRGYSGKLRFSKIVRV